VKDVTELIHRSLDPRPRKADLLVVSLLAAAFAWPLCRRGIVVSDEGYLLQQALEMLSGKLLYQDLDAFVTPGVWFVLAGLFSVFEPSVLVSRIPAFLGFVGMCVVCFRIAQRLAGRLAGALSVAGLFTFCVWAFPAWTFTFYSSFAMLFALWSMERLLAWRDSEHGRDLLAASLLVGLSVIFKQNYGVLAALGLVVGVLSIRIERGTLDVPQLARDAGWIVAGPALVGLPLILYLALTGSLPAALDSVVVRPFTSFVTQQTIPYLPLARLWSADVLGGPIGQLAYAATPMWRTPFADAELALAVQRAHVLLYWAPPLVFGGLLAFAAAPLARGQRMDGGLLAVAVGCGVLFLGVFPRPDFNHLMNVYQPVVLAGSVLVGRLSSLDVRRHRLSARAIATLLLVCALPFAIVAGTWYRGLFRVMNTPIPLARAGVLVGGIEASLLEFETSVMKLYTEEGESVLTAPDLAILNFLADRPAPAGHYELHPVNIGHDQGASVVAATERSGVRLAIVRSKNPYYNQLSLREYAPRLRSYLRSHFEVAFAVRFAGDLILRRRPAPLPERPVLEILEHCTADGPGGEILEYSLFLSLQQSAAAGERTPRAFSLACEITLPPEARTLSVLLDYLHPLAVEEDTGATMDLTLRKGERLHTLLREELAVEPIGALAIPPPLERRIDVSRWAGERVVLTFEAHYEGKWRISHFDGAGFTALWQDPVIELSSEPNHADATR